MLRVFAVLIPLLFLAACAAPPEPKQPGREDLRLEFAVKHANLRLVNTALSRKADPNTSGRNGTPVLIVAAMLQRADLLEALLKHGADVNIADEFGDTALHAAVASRKTDVVELLLKHHANPNAVGKYLRTPVLEAARLGRIENVKLLLAAGAAGNFTDRLVYGCVVDWLPLPCPFFGMLWINAADLWLIAGAGILVFRLFFPRGGRD